MKRLALTSSNRVAPRRFTTPYGGNTKMSLSSDFSKHQGDIIFSVLSGKLQKSLLQFSYPVMNNEPTRVTEDLSTLIGLVIASKVELIKKKTIKLELGISDHKLIYGCLQTKLRRPPPPPPPPPNLFKVAP